MLKSAPRKLRRTQGSGWTKHLIRSWPKRQNRRADWSVFRFCSIILILVTEPPLKYYANFTSKNRKQKAKLITARRQLSFTTYLYLSLARSAARPRSPLPHKCGVPRRPEGRSSPAKRQKYGSRHSLASRTGVARITQRKATQRARGTRTLGAYF